MRKAPTQHSVRAHQRKGEHGKKIYVRSHIRGSYFPKTPEERKTYHREHPYLYPRDRGKTQVIFRKDPDGTVVALFPEIQGSFGHITSYEHVGQHGAADYNLVMGMTKPASPEEYADLKEELEQRGYYLDVKQKRTKFGAEMEY